MLFSRGRSFGAKRWALLALSCLPAALAPAALGQAAEKGTGGNIGNVPLPVCLTLVGDSQCDGKASGDSGNGGGNTGGNMANYPVPLCITSVGNAKCAGPASGDSGPTGSGNSGGNIGNAPVPVCYTTVGDAECDGAASGSSGKGGKDTGGNVANYPIPECYTVIGDSRCDGKPSGDAGDPTDSAPPAATRSTGTAPAGASLLVPRQRMGSVLHRGLRTELHCAGACKVKSWLFVDRHTARKYGLASNGAQPTVIGRKSATLAAAGTGPVHIRLTPQARRAFAGARAVPMTLLVKVSDASGVKTSQHSDRIAR